MNTMTVYWTLPCSPPPGLAHRYPHARRNSGCNITIDTNMNGFQNQK